MTAPYPPHAAYKLKGRSFKAVSELVAKEKELLAEDPKMRRTGNKSLSESDRNLLRRDIMAEIIKDMPEQIEAIGLNASAIRIESHIDGEPRAYKHYPFIATVINEDKIEYVMLCPVDYKGDHHVPINADPIDEDMIVEDDFGELVLKGAGTLSGARLKQNESGTAVPADFDPENDFQTRAGDDKYKQKVFIAGGMSLSCVTEFVERTKAVEEAKASLIKEVEKLAPQIEKANMLGAEEGDNLRARCRIETDKDGAHSVWVEMINEQTGATVIPKDNELFLTTDYKKGRFRIEPNKDTGPGRQLGNLFSAMSRKPDLGQYWQLFNPTAPKDMKAAFDSNSKEGPRVPQLDTIRGVHYLVYTIERDAEKDNCKPPGGIPVSTAEYLWLKADIRDEERLIRPAEPSERLSHMQPVKPAAPAAG